MELSEFFKENPKAALGFSGGVDSSYLLYAGLKYGADIRPYYIKTAFQPEFEFEDAKRLAESLGAKLNVIYADILSSSEVTENPENRCFYCKTALFSMVKAQALKDGCSVVIDGTNASDDAGDRPVMAALCNLDVRSPLRECGLTKEQIRRLSRAAGLFTWNKPAYACLATRIPTGETITEEKLYSIEKAENLLFSLGFSDFRVRIDRHLARIELLPEQMHRAIDLRSTILENMPGYFTNITLDLNGR